MSWSFIISASILRWIGEVWYWQQGWVSFELLLEPHFCCKDLIYKARTVVFNSSKNWMVTWMISWGWPTHPTTLSSMCFFSLNQGDFQLIWKSKDSSVHFILRDKAWKERPYLALNINFHFGQLLSVDLIKKLFLISYQARTNSKYSWQ